MKQDLGIPYSRQETDVRLLDVFRPEDGGNGCGLFFIHGGGWRGGSRAAWHAVMEHFCSLGFVCASCGYHLAPAWHFPKQVEDVRLAFSLVKGRAAEYGFDPARLAVWGSSAGGHLAAMLAATAPEDDLGVTDELALRDTRPAAAVCLCSVLSCLRYEAHENVPKMIADFLGAGQDEDPELARRASPLDRVDRRAPPFLMVVGDQDRTTPVALHEAMRDRLAAHGAPAELIVLPGIGHGFGYGVATDAQKQTLSHAERFLRRTLGA